MGYRQGDPISFFGATLVRLDSPETQDLAEPPAFLPFAPATQLGVLPVERRLAYIERYLDSLPRSQGWLLYPSAIEAYPNAVEFGGPEDRMLNPARMVVPLLLNKGYKVSGHAARGEWAAIRLMKAN